MLDSSEGWSELQEKNIRKPVATTGKKVLLGLIIIVNSL